MNHVAASSHSGMGAIPYPGGTAFRVWAPHADRVHVAGTFNHWSKTANPLASEGNGYWSADVAGAKSGDEYKYVLFSESLELWRIDPYARHVTSSVGNGIIDDLSFDWGSEPYQTPPWNAMVIYEMHIGTFNDQPGGPPGNLSEAIAKLSHLQELGVNAIEIMPPYEFAGGFSWGYNPTYLFAIESDYGGPCALKEFVKAAHGRGMAVIFDVVYNHFGPGDLDLWQFDGWNEDGSGGIYFYKGGQGKTPWGPRPDYGRPEVRQFIRDNALMWLHEYRVDGLRWDATAYIRNVFGNDNNPANDISAGWSLMQWINDEIDAEQPWKINIAEDLWDNPWLTRSTGAGGAGFDAQWDGQFAERIREAIVTFDDQARAMDTVRGAIEHRFEDPDSREGTDVFERIIYTESHDEVANGEARVPEEIWPGNAGSWASKKRSTLGAALALTSPGIPMIFQGQEFLEDQWFRDEDPIDWSKKDRYSGILAIYRDLIRLRRNDSGTTRGLMGQGVHVHHVNDADKVIAFHRWDQGGPRDSVVVVANMANRGYDSYTIGLPREGLWKVRFNSDWSGYDPDFGNQSSYDTVADRGDKDGLPYHGNVGIGPYSVVILSQDS